MSKFPDRDDPVSQFKSRDCVDCDASAELEARTKIDYWLEYGYEKGHVGEETHLWLKHDDDWRCYDCATEFYHVEPT